jgi:hypothetical protein
MKYAILSLIILLFGTQLFAHPAGEVSMSYTAATQIVTVSFSHGVKSATEHYIEKVTLKLNNKVIVTQTLGLQDTISGGTLSYKVPGLKKGDVLEAVTECNKGGTKSRKLTLN